MLLTMVQLNSCCLNLPFSFFCHTPTVGKIFRLYTLNQLFIRDSNTEIKFSKKLNSGKSAFFVIGPFCSPHSIYLNISF